MASYLARPTRTGRRCHPATAAPHGASGGRTASASSPARAMSQLLLRMASFRCGVVAGPLGVVEVLAAVIHVIDHEPRGRGDVAVPRPPRLARVAVAAGTIEDRGHVRRHVGGQGISRIGRRIRPRRPDELDAGKENREDHQEQLEGSSHAREDETCVLPLARCTSHARRTRPTSHGTDRTRTSHVARA